MGWKLKNPFKKQDAHPAIHAFGMNGFGAPLAIVYGQQLPAPGTSENPALRPFLTYLSPRWTAIGGGIPNKRDIGTTAPAYSQQGVLVAQVGSPGILSGAFVSGPLTNLDTSQAAMPVAGFSNTIPQA